MKFDEWYEKSAAGKAIDTDKRILKRCWEAAQAEQQKEIDLLRAVYDYSRAAIEIRSPESLDILSCAIGCVERFDE